MSEIYEDGQVSGKLERVEVSLADCLACRYVPPQFSGPSAGVRAVFWKRVRHYRGDGAGEPAEHRGIPQGTQSRAQGGSGHSFAAIPGLTGGPLQRHTDTGLLAGCGSLSTWLTGDSEAEELF